MDNGEDSHRTVSQRPSRSNLRSSVTFDGSNRFNSLPRAIARGLSRRATAEEGDNPRRSMYARSKSYDDQTFHKEVQAGGAGNGVRVWYESYTTIDWIHDAVKDNSRLRRLRAMHGARGALINVWDRFQGWLVVTITGLITALIAAAIVKSEAVLFDLKEGYCSRNWRLAKRFCCPFGDQPDWDGGGSASASINGTSATTWSYHSRLMANPADTTKGALTGFGNKLLAGWAAPVASSPRWHIYETDESISCPDWVTWADKLRLTGEWNFVGEYGIYILVAVLWASIASILTIYLTSSELYVNRKEPLLAPPSSSTVPSSASVSPVLEQRPNITSDERTSLLDRHKDINGKRYDGSSTNILSDAADASRSSEALAPRKVLYFGSGSGISEVKCILGGFVVHGYLGFWTLFTKSVGLALSVASGLSLGKEGPFVHIASCVGNIVCRLFSKYETNESKRREILSCACAAGVAVAFGAPVGGVLFSLEEVSYYFPAKVLFRSFFCAMVAAATLRFLDPFGTGKIVLFQVSYDKDWHWVELGFFVVLGIFGGVYGALFTKLNMLWSKRVRATTWMAKHPLYEVMMITVLTVAVSFLNDYTRMGGPELIADLFSECHEHESLEGLCVSRPSQIGPLVSSVAWAMIVKGILTIITFGIKLPAGIFIPTLCVGACFGRIVGLLVQYAQWTNPESQIFAWCGTEQQGSACIVPGVYAMIGAAATLSGVTRTTISLVVIMFELTGTLTYSVPVMLSVLVARTIADALEHKGIYDLVLEFSGLPYLDAKEEHTWQGVTIIDALDADVEVIDVDESNTVASLREKLERLALVTRNPDGGFPITCSNEATTSTTRRRSGPTKRRLVGYIAAQELEHGLNRVMAAEDGDVDPSRLVCSFNFLPRPDAQSIDRTADAESSAHGVDRASAEQYMRDSTLLASIDSPRDLSIFVDRAPITLTTYSPLELVHQMFVKLGVRYLIVLNADGTLNGVIFKKRWLAFLHTLDEGEKHA